MEFKKVKDNFIYVAFDRTIQTRDEMAFKRIKKFIAYLSMKYNLVLYDNPEFLSEEEGLSLTNECLNNSKLGAIIFIMDSNLDSIVKDSSLDSCIRFCVQKDNAFKEKKDESLDVYGPGIQRYLISLCENPQDLILSLNSEHDRFYNPDSICYSLTHTDKSVRNIYEMYAHAMDSFFRNKITLHTLTRKKCFYYPIKRKPNDKKIKKGIQDNEVTVLSVRKYDETLLDYLSLGTDVFIEVRDKYRISKVISENYTYEGNVIALYHMIPEDHELYSYIETLVFKKDKSFYASVVRSYIKRINNKDLNKKTTFISYSHKDNMDKNVTNLVDRMNTAGIVTFFDVYNFVPGDLWMDQAKEIIASNGCNKLFCYISEAYLKSSNCLQEIEYMCNKRGKKEFVFYDPNKLLDNLENIPKIAKDKLVECKLLNPKKNTLQRVKIVRTREEILKLYDCRALDIEMKERSIVLKYNITNGKENEAYITNLAKPADTKESAVIELQDKKCYYVMGEKRIPLKKYEYHCQKYFLNDEDDEIYESKSKPIEKPFYLKGFKRFYSLILKILCVLSIVSIVSFFISVALGIGFLYLTIICAIIFGFYYIGNSSRMGHRIVSLALILLFVLPFDIGALYMLKVSGALGSANPRMQQTTVFVLIMLLMYNLLFLFVYRVLLVEHDARDFIKNGFVENIEDIDEKENINPIK